MRRFDFRWYSLPFRAVYQSEPRWEFYRSHLDIFQVTFLSFAAKFHAHDHDDERPSFPWTLASSTTDMDSNGWNNHDVCLDECQ